MSRTVSDLILEVRENLEEYNENSITDGKILSAMNRGQKQAMSILADRAEEVLLDYYEFDTTGGVDSYALPSDILAQKVDAVDILSSDGSFLYAIERANVKTSRIERSVGNYIYSGKYILQGNNMILAPTPSATFKVRVWYAKRLDRLTLDQGRIVAIDTNSLTVDSVGSNISNDVNSLEAFISVIDGNTGAIKGTYQVSSAAGVNPVTIRTSGLGRTIVFQKTVSSSLSSDIAVDDYICSAIGTCISQLPDMFQDYVVQYATSQIIVSIGEDNSAHDKELRQLEQRIKSAWAGKEKHLKVNLKSERSRYPYFVTTP